MVVIAPCFLTTSIELSHQIVGEILSHVKFVNTVNSVKTLNIANTVYTINTVDRFDNLNTINTINTGVKVNTVDTSEPSASSGRFSSIFLLICFWSSNDIDVLASVLCLDIRLHRAD